jgi:hypothetical protein
MIFLAMEAPPAEWPQGLTILLFVELHPAPGAKLVLVAVELLAAALADEHELLGAVRAIGKGLEQVLLIGREMADLLSAIGIMADLFD